MCGRFFGRANNNTHGSDEKNRKEENRATGGKEKVPILQKINLIQKSFTKPLGTPTEGFVFLNFK